MSTREKVYILIAQGKNTKEISDELNISLRTAQHYHKEYVRGETQTQKRKENAKKKIRKEKAKALVITGATTREAAEEANLNQSTVKYLSRTRGLQETQAEFLKRFAKEQKKLIMANKIDRLKANTVAKKKIESTIMRKTTISKTLQETLMLNEKVEHEILESDRLIRLERLELERQKIFNDGDNANKKLDDYLDKLVDGLGDD